ncbi:MAG: hypothetical protein C4318_07260 [Acidimicrobiia bacterium]
MISAIHRAHIFVAFLLTGACAVGGIWSAYCWAKKKNPARLLRVWYVGCYALVYCQVALGAILYGRGLRPGDVTHVLYGITPAVVILVLQASKKSIEPRMASVMTIVMFAFAGMGVRGIITGFG